MNHYSAFRLQVGYFQHQDKMQSIPNEITEKQKEDHVTKPENKE